MNERKKQLKQEFAQSHPPVGIYQIRNLINGKIFIGSSENMPGLINRTQFQLKLNGHPNKKLQGEWNEFGAENFVFEILDEVKTQPDPNYDYKPDLAFLEEYWLEHEQPYDDRGYNERKLSPEEKLRKIAENRLKNAADRN